MSLIESILQIAAPHECIGCGLESDLLCSGCVAGLAPVPSRCYRCLRATDNWRTCTACRKQSSVFSVQTITAYEGNAKNLVGSIKFERTRAGAATVAEILSQKLTLPKEVLITHLPTATSRVRQRGYDQAALIAKCIARQRRLPYSVLLARSGQDRQVGKNRSARQSQLLHAFYSVTADIQNRDILLVDDVITTGSTLEAAARVLKQAGAKRVYGAVFAAA